MSLHIVTCAPNYLPDVGGAEIGLHTLLRHCHSSTNYRFSVIAGTSQPDLPGRECIDGVEVHRFRWPARSVNWYAPTASALIHMPASVLRLRPDVVHLSYALPSGPGAWLGAALARVPYLLSVGGNDVADPVYPPPRQLRKVAAAIGRHAPHVISWTSPVRDSIVDQWGVDPHRVSVNPYGVDTDAFVPISAAERRAARVRWGCRRGGPVLLGLQRLETRKGVDVLVDAAALLQKRGLEFELLIGGTGREERSLRDRCAEAGLSDRVRFLGSVAEELKPELMSMADLFLLASRHEGQGIALAEAAACGTPAVSTSAGGTVDMVEPGHTGLLVPPNNAKAFADAVANALSDDTRLLRWRLCAREHATRDLSVHATAQRFIDIVETLVR